MHHTITTHRDMFAVYKQYNIEHTAHTHRTHEYGSIITSIVCGRRGGEEKKRKTME